MLINENEESILCVPCQWSDILAWAIVRVGAEHTPLCKWHYFNGINRIKKEGDQ